MPEDKDKVQTPDKTKTVENTTTDSASKVGSENQPAVDVQKELEDLKKSVEMAQQKLELEKQQLAEERMQFSKEQAESKLADERSQDLQKEVENVSELQKIKTNVQNSVDDLNSQNDDLQFVRQQRIAARKAELLKAGVSEARLNALIKEIGGEEQLIAKNAFSAEQLINILKNETPSKTATTAPSPQAVASSNLTNQSQNAPQTDQVNQAELDKERDKAVEHLYNEHRKNF